MRRNTLLADVAIAAVLAVLALTLAPGLAVIGLLAIVILVLCGVSFVVGARRRR